MGLLGEEAVRGPLVESPVWAEYALLDSGGRRKLERFGGATVIRGEPKAWWRARETEADWKAARAEVRDGSSAWKLRGKVARSWTVTYERLNLEARLTDGSKHVGIFPEQEPHWRWLKRRLSAREQATVLNLFGYTGVASLVSAAAGARVTHVDASKPAVAWARRNQELSGLGDAPIRWIVDDAFKFVGREIRRGRRYDAVLLDPPSFGRGPRGEVWKVEQQLVQLLEKIRQLLPERGGLVVMTLYNLEASSLMLRGLVEDQLGPGRLEFGELALRGEAGGRYLPMSLFTRWEDARG